MDAVVHETKARLTLSAKLKRINKSLKSRLTMKRNSDKLVAFLRSAGVHWQPGEYMAFRVIAAIIAAGLLDILHVSWVLPILGAFIGFFYPKLWVSGKRKKRLKQFNDGLADMISSLINSLRAGFSFLQALKAVEEESEEPIKGEIGQVLKEMQYGSSLEEALKNLYERVPSDDLDILIQAVLIQRQVGGNLATVLSSIVETIRERIKLQGQVKTLTAQGKMSGMVIGGLPFGLGGIIFVISPSYMSALFHNVIGILLISVAVVSGIIGFVLIQKITKVEV
ncbi:type II secretion system F family protein [Pullulanibacillus sp. KACC 23026]|uniref:type II secretion system F family protein n=1 Tax=Pullulanibacillus sp. KACC 23026 TaxID=3028315 RepID=UPI0023B17302|nr:type II secretion system F family protein [Pullulanibacillus sp. KACC 23026]WEG13582.1 type II secretion system F family protein [Pullulanibacillus sp. KACC 23026]